ncbi:MAG: uracil-DNA glycosylase family protein [Halobacteriales archaeon]
MRPRTEFPSRYGAASDGGALPGSRRHIPEPDCDRCPEFVSSRERIARGNSSLDAVVVVVGEAPGVGNPDADRWRGGNWTGCAYTARHSGRLVRRLFAEVGYGPDGRDVSNAVRCHPAADDPTTNREPTAVVPRDRYAAASMLALAGGSLDGLLETGLETHPFPELGATVVPRLHPSSEAVGRRRLGSDTRAASVAAVGEALSSGA